MLSLMLGILIVLSQISRGGSFTSEMWCGIFKPLITCKTTSALVLSLSLSLSFPPRIGSVFKGNCLEVKEERVSAVGCKP